MEGKEENYFGTYQNSAKILETASIKNIEYSTTGELFSYTTDGILKIYSAVSGAIKNIININMDCMKYFQRHTLLHSQNNQILYLSIYDNKHLRKFDGHSGRIREISVDSSNDLFMSIGEDLINMWDIRMKDPIKNIRTNRHFGAMSSENLYFISDDYFVRIYDRRSDTGPVVTREIQPNFYQRGWFTGDNSVIALEGTSSCSFLDCSGNPISFVSMESENQSSTTMDSSTLLYGSKKHIFAYRIRDRAQVGVMESPEANNFVIRANPEHPQFLSASEHAILLYTDSNL